VSFQQLDLLSDQAPSLVTSGLPRAPIIFLYVYPTLLQRLPQMLGSTVALLGGAADVRVVTLVYHFSSDFEVPIAASHYDDRLRIYRMKPLCNHA
jgi:hypothetical protein